MARGAISAAAVAAMRELGLYKPPGVAESIDWARALARLGQGHLDEHSVRASLGVVLKYREDQDPLREGVIYVGTDDGRAHVTMDTGKNWREILDGVPTHRWISRMEASRFDAGTVYMSQNGKRHDDFKPYVWKSTDYGSTWTSIAANVPVPDQRQILRDATIDAMTNESVGSGPGFAYGLGLGLILDDHGSGYMSVGHNGGMPGGASELKMIPEKRIVVAVTTNRYTDMAYEIADDVVGVLLPDYGKHWKEAKASRSSSSRQPFTPTDDLVGEWQGELVTWLNTYPVVMTIHADSDVHIKVGDQMETVLNGVRFADGLLSGRFAGHIFTEDAGRQEHYLELDRLALRGDTLAGALQATAPTSRRHYSLPSWIRLTRRK